MKKRLCLLGIFVLVLAVFQPVMAGSMDGVNLQGDLPPGEPDDDLVFLFLPTVITISHTYSLSGQIKDAQDIPLSGATVWSDIGRITSTDANGVFQLEVGDGEQILSAQKDGYDFDPLSAELDVQTDINNLNFTALAACRDEIPNPSFEVVPYYWNPISGNANGYTPYYSASQANTGFISGFTGIQVGQVDRVSWSRWRSHEIYIPTTATSADLSLFYWPSSSDTGLAAEPAMPDMIGLNTESPDLPTYDDAQYINIVDVNNLIIGQLLWTRSNAQTWTATGALSLLPWVGRIIKLEFGTYNDGFSGVTSAFFDDVQVTVCDGAIPSCTNIMLNSNFEGVDGWVISPANIQSTYTTQYWKSAFQSMLSGVPVGTVNPFPYQWTTGEFVQNVTIPADAISARLKMRLLPKSSYQWGYHVEEQAALDAAKNTNAPEATESQYGHIRDATNTTTLFQMFKWFPIDSAYWLYREYNLIAFSGQTIGVLFGAANDGFNGNTALYVDEVYLEVCTSAAP